MGNTNIKGMPGCHYNTLDSFSEQYLWYSPIPHLVVKEDGIILFANQAALNIVEYNSDELIDNHFSMLLEAGQTFSLQESLYTHLPVHFSLKKKKGALLGAEAHFQKFNGEDFPKITVALIVSNSQKLSSPDPDAAYNLSLFLNNSEESLLLVDKDIRMVMCNQICIERAKKWLNFDLVKGSDPTMMALPEERESIKSLYERTLQGERIEFEFSLNVDEGQIHLQNIFKPAYKDGHVEGVFVIARDITAIKESKAALAVTEQRWRYALEGSNKGVWDWNLVTGQTFYSAAWKKLLGFHEDEISNHIDEWGTRVHPDDKQGLERHIKKHLDSNQTNYETEYRLRAKDGNYRWILARGFIVSRDEQGKPTRMVGTHTDITDRKNIEEKYKLLFYNNPLPMWTFNKETHRFLDVNHAAIEHYGYSKEEFLSMSLLDIRPTDQKENFIEWSKNNGKTNPGENQGVWQHQKKNGEIIYVDVVSKSFNEGEHRHNLVLAQDITEKVIADQKLVKAMEQYSTLFHAHPYPSWILESETYRFLKVNDAAIAHYGYTKDEFLQMTILDILPLDQRQAIKNRSFEAINDHYTLPGWVHIKKNGEHCIVDVKGREINHDGTKAFLAVVVDVTAKVNAEKKLLESNERYLLATKATSEAIYEWDLTTNMLQWNETFFNLFGYQSQITMEEWLSYLHEDNAGIQDDLHHVLYHTVDVFWKGEYQFRRSDGVYRSILERGFIVRNEKNEPIRMIGSMRDVTEQQERAKELLASNERFQLVAQATSEVLWEGDFTKQTGYLSPAFKDVFGFDISTADYFKNWQDYIHPDDLKKVVSLYYQIIKDPDCYKGKIECRHRKSDGTYAYIVNHFILLRNKKGEVTKIVGAINDISSRKEAEQELLRTNERFLFATKATSDIIWDYDKKTGTVLLSDNYQKVMGWPLPENRGLPLEECILRLHPEESDAITTKLFNTINDPNKSRWEDEFRYKKADGSYAYVVDRGFIIRDDDGHAVRMIGAMQDITDRKYQEEIQSLELRVFEVSAVPGIHFHNVLKTLITGLEALHPDMFVAISLHHPVDEIEMLVPRLAKEHSRQLRYFVEKQKERLQEEQTTRKNIMISATENDDWRYASEAAKHYNWKVSWTLPVYHHNGDLLAFLLVFLDTPRTPTGQEMNSLARIRNLMRIIIGNYLSLEQIRISNERYDNVLKATHDLVWDWNLETGKFYRNAEGLKKVYGVKKAEDIENVYSWMQRIHPEDHAKVQKVINNILHATNQDTFDVEYRFKTDEGNYASIYDRGVIVRNKEGKPLRMIGAAQNVTDRKLLEQELLQKELDKQKLISQATIDTQEEERREIGKELHDNVNQVLTTTKLYLDLSLSSPELKDELIKKSSKNIIYVINEIRQLSRSLMDPSIGDLGLIDSINDLVENINITRKLHVTVSADAQLEKKLDESQKLTIFRIIQEAMNNTIKYAQATTVHLGIKKNKKLLELSIIDDGVGFNPDTVKRGAGLKNINNRVYLANGKLHLDTAPGKGCTMIINFPINNKKQSN